jgi:hypothetical protein
LITLRLSIGQQCKLLSILSSSYYYKPKGADDKGGRLIGRTKGNRPG